MKKIFYICIITIFAVALIAPLAYSESKDFRISVTIPVIPGVNAPAITNSDIIDASMLESQKEIVESFALSNIDYEETLKNDGIIIVKTITDF